MWKVWNQQDGLLFYTLDSFYSSNDTALLDHTPETVSYLQYGSKDYLFVANPTQRDRSFNLVYGQATKVAISLLTLIAFYI
mmetsp:Transcript_16171/g.15556  ORF Transcript_16171/g.15556 Transcript_16171/m.15556 type:complete len:81 (-) Transcript_16171:33-275(-)